VPLDRTPAQRVTDVFSAISSLPLSERIAEQIREMIFDGDFPAGAPLIEVALAARFGVSRAPVRDALKALSHDGLVDTVPYRGTTVRGVRRQDVEDLAEIRALHETYAARRIVARGLHRDLSSLLTLCDEMDAVAESGDLRALSVVDERFHRELVSLSGNELLVSFWRSVAMQVRQVMLRGNRYIADARAIVANHRRIVEALADGRGDEAADLLERHIAGASAALLAGWSEGAPT
jgi:DNA-binding GntR family transcriptional regulator